jgi:N6-adenosine-specific RNA methylase IME4
VIWPFGDLRQFGYQVLYADPPWPFENYSAKGESRNPNRHYETMSLAQLKALPVGHLAAETCALFMWVTDPLLPQAIEVMQAWGFRFATVAFTWAKRTRLDTGWHMGTGYYTRANPEMCLLGMNGRRAPRVHDVRQLVVDSIRQHSRKPDRVRTDIERMYPGPYLELFARQPHPGWDSWGLETTKFPASAATTGSGNLALAPVNQED